MIINRTGQIIEDLYMVGHPAMPVYLLDGEKPVIFDAGLTFLGDLYTNGIRQIIGSRDLHYCFLSHSHFDHCGSVSILKKKFPGLKVVASEKAKKVFGRPNAIELMRNLTRAAQQLTQYIDVDISESAQFEPFEVDLTLADGDFIELAGDVAVQAIETPGHTRDSLSYFAPHNKVLLCSEAAGVPDATGYIVSEALVDYDHYYESMKRLSRVEFDVLCLGHRQALTGRDARDYLSISMADCRYFLRRVETALGEENGDVPKVVARIKSIEYDPIPAPKQIEPAYLLNLEAKVKVIKRRLELRTENQKLAN